MLYTLTTIALALIGAVRAKPLDTAIGDLSRSVTNPMDVFGPFPVADLGSVPATPSVALSNDTVHVDAPPPTSLFLCAAPRCTDCTAYDLDLIPHNTCYVPGVEAVSLLIVQLEGENLPYSVSIGPSNCTELFLLTQVNYCFVINNATYDSVYLAP